MSPGAAPADGATARQGHGRVDRVAGLVTLKLLFDWDAWVHRRVESIELRHPVAVMRRISLDFTLPADAALSPPPETASGPMAELLFFVPLAFLRKGPMTNFSLRDEHGAPVPVLTRRRDGALAASVLVTIVEGAAVLEPGFAAAFGPEMPETLQGVVWEIVTGDLPQSELVLEDLLEPRTGETDQLAAWRARMIDDPRFVALAHTFARSFLLCAPLWSVVGKRRILKFSYEEHGRQPRLLLPGPLPGLAAWWARLIASPPAPEDATSTPRATREALTWLGRAIGWEAIAMQIDTPGITQGGSYHFELEAPEGMQITRALLQTDATVQPPTAECRQSRQRVHLYMPPTDPAPSVGAVLVNLRPHRFAIARSAWFASVLSLLVLGVTAILASEIVENLGAAMPLLLLVPAGVGAYVARSRESEVATEALFGLRVVAAAPAAWSFGAALALAAGTHCASVGLSQTACRVSVPAHLLVWTFVLLAAVTTAVLSVTLTMISRPIEQRSAAGGVTGRWRSLVEGSRLNMIVGETKGVDGDQDRR